ncbi:hypothetical protein [Sinorhizobium sp. BJ1]|uniref:hypothetical protein n=1 Tax=Sinorhizobium sp. BJ1 TaxID=2035455 RepID=UPI000BE96D4C|nr:hypothetical protein [Sinorhizobium sp. BJ1]PDT80574.1 hypothetical protein CO676_26600 [Sinorhizobium sp. BJ1]
MSLRDCLNSAVEQGAINSRQAEELHRYYDARFRRKRAGMTEREAAAAARAEVVDALREEAKELRRQVKLNEARRKEIAEFIENYRDRNGNPNQLDAVMSLMIHNGFKGTQSMAGKANAIIAMAHRDLSEVMYHFRRSKGLGLRQNKADLPDLIKAMHGEPTSNATAKALAGALSGVLEDLRLRFNAAGGNIPKRQDWGIVHSHNRREIRKLGRTPEEARARWKDFIRPLLDPEQMTNPNTGEVIGADGLDASLDYVFETITSDGWAHRRPEARRFGQGKTASRYQDSRFLIFRDAQSWLAYNERFGNQDAIGSIFNHINGIARDIASMERFGPNPDATMEWLKQAVQVDIGKRQAGAIDTQGKPPGMSAVKWAGYRIDSLWRALRGRETVLDAPAKIAGDVRNLATSAMLGSTGILAASTDPFVSAAARRLAGLPVTSTLGPMLKRFARDGDRRAMARRAVIWEDYLHTMNENARFVDQMFGHEWSRYLVDRSLTWNGLSPLTDARKRVEAGAWHETLGGFAEKNTDWIELHPLLKNAMEGFGITADDWHKMRAGVDDMGFLDPGGVFAKTGDRALAEKYAEMILQWSERSVPAGDPRIKSVLTGGVPRGTILGEIGEFGSQFLSFGMSFTARQLEAVYLYSMLARSSRGKLARGAWYFAAMAIPLTIGAAFYQQVLNVLNGKDPEDMTTFDFWGRAFVKGGGGGLFADFVNRAENRFGQSFAETLPGPGAAFIGDTLDLTLRTIRALIPGGEDQKLGRNASKYVGRYTPVLASHPATRMWYRRAFVDQLQWLTDPDADRSFQAQKRANSSWWEPGELQFRRLPAPEAALGEP